MKWLLLAITLIYGVLASCSGVNTNPYGEWTRDVSDETMGISGIERLILNTDSTMQVVNELSLTHADSLFNCSIQFTTTVSGQWYMTKDKLILKYDTNSFDFDTIAGKTYLSAINTDSFSDSIRNKMICELTARLAEYYQSAYQTVCENGPLQLNDVICNSYSLKVSSANSDIIWSR